MPQFRYRAVAQSGALTFLVISATLILVFFLLYVAPQFLVISLLILSIMSALLSLTELAT